MAIFGAVGVPFATHAVSDAIVIVGLDADMSSGAAVGGRPMRFSVVEDLLPRLKGSGRGPTPVIVFYSKEVSRETADGIRAALVKSQTSNDALLQVIHLAIEKG